MAIPGLRDDHNCCQKICRALMALLFVAMIMSTLLFVQTAREIALQGPKDDTNKHVGSLTSEEHGDTSAGMLAVGGYEKSYADRLTEEARDYPPNDAAWLLRQEQKDRTSPCHHKNTTQALLEGLDPPSEGHLRLATNRDHHLTLVAYDGNGVRRCTGGDFYEADLSGEHWKSRPPTEDLEDGKYQVTLRVDGRLAGTYTFKVILLFDNLHGLEKEPQKWFQSIEVLNIHIEFFNSSEAQLLGTPVKDEPGKLKICTPDDFKVGRWHGRWIQSKANESCSVDEKWRLRCLDPNESCVEPWCAGPLGMLESNGWAYSAHCTFRIFTQDEAWRCLRGRRLLFWGDSNHQDTIRNLLNFILGLEEWGLRRSFHANYSNPANSSEIVWVTSLFNGHVDDVQNFMGLAVLKNMEYRIRLRSILEAAERPDTIILNSGLHDAKFWPNLTLFAEGARNAIKFWEDIWKNTSDDPSARPKLLFRTTVAPAGASRNMSANPRKMEAFNTILVEEFVSRFGTDALKVVDAYDMTFPWHYDNKLSDGGHYGRPSFWGYICFVDVMLAHVLLNAICPA